MRDETKIPHGMRAMRYYIESQFNGSVILTKSIYI